MIRRIAAMVGVSLAATVSHAAPDTFGVGNGQDGAFVAPAGASVINDYAVLEDDEAVGSTVIRADTDAQGTPFEVGDLILIVQNTGLSPVPSTGDQTAIDLSAQPAGTWEFARIAGKTGSRTFTLKAG